MFNIPNLFILRMTHLGSLVYNIPKLCIVPVSMWDQLNTDPEIFKILGRKQLNKTTKEEFFPVSAQKDVKSFFTPFTLKSFLTLKCGSWRQMFRYIYYLPTKL